MTQRIVDDSDGSKCDGGLTVVEIERLREVARKGNVDPGKFISEVRRLADEAPAEEASPERQQAAIDYIDALPEPQRTIYVMHMVEGANYRDVAKKLGLEPRYTLKSLATIYSKLRFILLPG